MKGRTSGRKWMVCAGATLMLFCAGGLIVSAFSVYLPYIVSANGFTNTQSSSLLTIRSLVGLLLVLAADVIIKKIGPHLSSALSILTAAVGLFLYSTAKTYPGYCTAAVFCGAAFGVACIAAPILIEGWFTENRGFALGIATAGTGIASIISPVIIVPLIEKYSLGFAFRAEAIFVAACAGLIFLMVKNPPAKGGVQAAGNGQNNSAVEKKGVTFLLPPGRKIMLYAAVFLGGLIVFGITAAMPSLFKEQYGGTGMSVLTSVFGVALMAGKIVYGRLTDRKGTYSANYILFVLLVAGMIGAVCARQQAAGAVAAVCLGMGTPLNNLGVPTYAKDFCREGAYAGAVKYLTLTGNIAGVVISFAAGFVADIFGSYVPVFVILMVLVLVCAVLTQLVYIRQGQTRPKKIQ